MLDSQELLDSGGFTNETAGRVVKLYDKVSLISNAIEYYLISSCFLPLVYKVLFSCSHVIYLYVFSDCLGDEENFVDSSQKIV